jgi:hypothetical protein
MVPGITPDLLYGTFRSDGQGALKPFGGLFHYMTTQGSGMIDANYAAAGTLRAAGVDEGTIEQLLARREQAPLTGSDFRFGQLPSGTPGMAVGVGGGGQAYTLRATAELANGRATRTVAALVEVTQGAAEAVRRVRWYEQAL